MAGPQVLEFLALLSSDLSAETGLVPVVVVSRWVTVVVVPQLFLFNLTSDLSEETGLVLVVVVVPVCVVACVPLPFLPSLIVTLIAVVPSVVAELLCLGMR